MYKPINQMRLLRFLPLGLLILMSCSKEDKLVSENQGMGEITISLSSSDSSDDVTPLSKSVEENVPDVNDFEVEIYNSRGIRLYRDSYANSAGKKIPLNSGEYRLLAQHGDSAGVGFNADKAWFSADQTFTVHPQTSESISAVARMNKVKVAVKLGSNLLASYSDLYTLVRHAESSKELKFVKDETRAGYTLAGKLELEIYAYDSESSKWLYYPVNLSSLSDTEDLSIYKPNSFVTFNLEMYDGEGTLGGVTINVDITVDGVTKEYEIPVDAAPKDAPSVDLFGFSDNAFNFVEGVEYEEAQVDIRSMAGIKSCTLNIVESQYRNDKGVSGAVDLLSTDPAVKSTLESIGLRWVNDMKDKRLGSIDFSGLSKTLSYTPEASFSGKFTITVTDNLDREATSPEFTVSQQPAELVFTPADYNAFARRLRGLTASTSNGDPKLVSVQYSQDGQSWTTVSPASVADASASYDDITGLASATKYMLRAIYNGNENNVSETVELTTETEQQVGNAGFEEWTTQEHKFTYLGNHNINWDLPWLDDNDKWWAVNSKKAMPSSTSVVSANWNWVRFPTVAYTTDCHDGSRAAMVYSVNVGDWLTSTATVGDRIAGELFLGTSNDSGDHSSDGHVFNSRPSLFRFHYKYLPKDSETFYVKIEIKDSNNEVIAVSEKTDGGASSDWSLLEFPLSYQDISKKASNIYITFKSTTASKPGVTGNYELTIRDNEKYTGNFGSILYVDNLELIYE